MLTASSRRRQKRKILSDSDDVVPDGQDICQDDGCGRFVTADEYLSCKGPGCGGVVSVLSIVKYLTNYQLTICL
jgi:hypothetical protein